MKGKIKGNLKGNDMSWWNNIALKKRKECGQMRFIDIGKQTKKMVFCLVVLGGVLAFGSSYVHASKFLNLTNTLETNEVGQLQIQKIPKNGALVNERNDAKGSFFMVYNDPNDLESFIEDTYLEIGEDGYSNLIELPIGTYYVREAGTAPGFLANTEMYEVVIEKDKTTLATIECEPLTLEIPMMAFSGVSGKNYTSGHVYDNGITSPVLGNKPGWNYMGTSSNVVYCVQPGVILGIGETYKSSTTRPFFLKESTIKKLEIINYYATKYKKYDWRLGYAIAQSMMWRTISDEGTASEINDYGSSNAHFYISVDGTRVDKTPEWKEVKANIAKHYTKPSFNTKTYEVKLNTPYKLQDTNGVLSKYTFGKVNGVTISKSGNTVTFTVTDPKLTNTTIKIPYNFYADSKDGKSLYYRYQYVEDNVYYSGYQMCAEFYVSDVQSGYVNLKIGGTGDLTIEKSSLNKDMTDGNNAYSLQGAEYTIYSDETCTNVAGKLVTNEAGKTNSLSLQAGTYWIKETKAPKGYTLDTTVHKVVVTAGQKNIFKTTDTPQNAMIELLLKKVDAKNEGNLLKDAEFTFKFYAGEYADGINPASLGVIPTRTWVMKTNVDGVITFKEENKVSGDVFYLSSTNKPTLPLGTLTIQETKAPVGYHLNDMVFVRKIIAKGTEEHVNTYNMPTVMDNAICLQIVKYEKNSEIAVPNVEFEHQLPDGKTEILKTNAKGEITLSKLVVGQHKISEKTTIDGLVVNPNAFSFTVNKDGSITNNTNALDEKSLVFTLDTIGNGKLTVYNDFASFSLDIHKVNNHGSYLPDAYFALYSDKDCTQLIEELKTDENGLLTFKNLNVDTIYYLKETKAPLGYQLPLAEVYEIEISKVSPSLNEFTFKINDEIYSINDTSGTIHLKGEPDNYTIDITITNQILIQLPNTGTASGLYAFSLSAPLALVCLAYVHSYKKRKGENKDEEITK